jgi:lysophospholipase L1-like esterase
MKSRPRGDRARRSERCAAELARTVGRSLTQHFPPARNDDRDGSIVRDRAAVSIGTAAARYLGDMSLHRISGFGIAMLTVVIGCHDAPTGPASPMFDRYVALGNSITAGFQSGGIDDASQRESYAALIARQARARYAYASLGAGCPPPIDNLLDAISTGTINGNCAVSGQTPGRKLLNNVAVPGADSFDPIAATPSTDALTSLILDGRSQVDKALEATPTFVSIWIGNNDVLAAAITGQLGANGPTPQATFAANYSQMVNRLHAGGVDNGVLIGVSDVTRIPLLIPAAALADPSLRIALSFATGKTVTIATSCTGSASLISLAIIPEIATGAHPASIACTATPGLPVGDRFVLDAAERAVLVAAVAEYNVYISAKADSVGYAYYDPNPLFIAARARGDVPTVPDVANLSAPFGPLFSLDGVHPSARGQIAIANELIALIAAEYSVRLRPVP